MPSASRCLHFGVDDVLGALVQASDQRMPLFAHPFVAALAELHAQSGASIDLYLFLEGIVAGQRRSLHDVTGAVGDDLARAPWLRLGPHGLDCDTPPYRQTPDQQRATFAAIYREIDRLAGRARRSRVVRLHCFSESCALADYWHENGVEALLLTDRPAVAHELPPAVRDELAARGVARHAGMQVRRTHERVEALAAAALSDVDLFARLDGHVERHGRLVLCTHESELLRADVRATALRCLRYAHDRGLVTA